MKDNEPLLPPPPAEPLLPPAKLEPLLPSSQPAVLPQPLAAQTPGMAPIKPPQKHLWRLIVAGIALLIVVIIAVVIGLFRYELSPLSPHSKQLIVVDVQPGMTPPQIGQLLQDKKVIRSERAFDLYTRLSRSRDNLQAGTYHLSPADSVASLIEQLQKGKVVTFKVRFAEGGTIFDAKKALTDAGFSSAEVEAAMNASYTSPVLSDRPASASLEGYIYGDTYVVSSGETAQQVLQQAIDELATKVAASNVEAGFAAHNLTFYQGLTLASIVQSEDGNPSDQKQIAAVFYNRLAADMALGSDVTYHYGATLLGVAPTPDLDSPYNTRINKGLPPGPISSPTLSALQAVADPASNDDLFFLSGDDGKLYLSNTEAGHEANIAAYCQKKCSMN